MGSGLLLTQSVSPGDSGDTVSFGVNVTHDYTEATSSDAYEMQVRVVLSPYLTITSYTASGAAVNYSTSNTTATSTTTRWS